MKHTLVIPALSNDRNSQKKIGKNISRFLILAALSVAFILAIWGIVKPFTTSLLGTSSNAAVLPVHNKVGVMLGSVWAEGTTVRAPAANFNLAPASIPSGTILSAHPAISLPAGTMLGSVYAEGLTVRSPAANFTLAPASISAAATLNAHPAIFFPAGRILVSIWAEGLVVRAPAANFTIAPVFDATGAIVSDPTGTIL